MIRIILAHPPLAELMDQSVLDALLETSPDGAQMLTNLVQAAQSLGKHAQFAALSDHLRSLNSDFDELIVEIAGQSETDIDLHRQELGGAIRNIKIQQIKAAQAELANRGLQGEADKLRYYELKKQLDELNRQNSEEIALR